MTLVTASPTLSSPISGPPEAVPFTLAMLERALREKDELRAVERFSADHDHGFEAGAGSRYEALLPARPPAPGQQYAFEVDLDLCTGCKACVVACHSQNGLDEGESFRSVGFLHGGDDVAPFQQTVTTACHHCLDPACMHGCPVLAYEKDPVTGIVHHLDDQCIGCQYCVFTCPYEVPRFNADKGIVRKCDMCRGRLEVGEAPACVAGCPNGAIAIRVVDVSAAAERGEVGRLVPGAPASSVTRPTTTYKSRGAMPPNTLPADHHRVRPAAGHGPLVLMLVFTQLSVGAFAVEALVRGRLPEVARGAFAGAHAPLALAVGLFSLVASVAHLGRPAGAFRAVLGLRTSWLSREIVAFGAFALAAVVHAVASASPALRFAGPVLSNLVSYSSHAVVALGTLGVFSSVMVYHVTGRSLWHVAISGPRFFGTAAVLGLASTIVSLTAAAHLHGSASLAEAARDLGSTLALATAAKVAVDLSVLLHLRDRTLGDLRRTARLLVGELASSVLARVVFAVLGAIVLPAVFEASGAPSAAAVVGSLTSLAALVAGELLERGTFFRAEVGSRMPGGHA